MKRLDLVIYDGKPYVVLNPGEHTCVLRPCNPQLAGTRRLGVPTKHLKSPTEEQARDHQQRLALERSASSRPTRSVSWAGFPGAPQGNPDASQEVV